MISYQCHGGPMDGLLVPVPFPVHAWVFRDPSDPLKRDVYQFKLDAKTGGWRLVYIGKLDVVQALEKLNGGGA